MLNVERMKSYAPFHSLLSHFTVPHRVQLIVLAPKIEPVIDATRTEVYSLTIASAPLRVLR